MEIQIRLEKPEKFKILEGIYLVNKALWLEKLKLLAIADLHIGYEEYLNEQGIAIPRQQLSIMKKELALLLDSLRPRQVVINGDLKHEFGEISKQEWKETNEILDLILARANVILVKGNHDTILEPIARKKGLEIFDYFCADSICFMHGHRIFDEPLKKSKTLILAHIHPAIKLREGIRSEKYKCWLVGAWKKRNVIIMPSFLFYIEGAEILSSELPLPISPKNFSVFAIEDKIYKLGKLEKL
ncbi:MAG: metallophosphoesterase [Candidatus Pacearchaeota archaeon]